MERLQNNPYLFCLFGVSVLLCLGPATASWGIADTFSDGTFDNSDWSIDLVTVGPGGSITGTQINSGGNPGDFRKVTNTLAAEGGASSIFGFHKPLGATFNPSVTGPITSISYSLDYKNILTAFAGQAFGLTLRQNGNFYRSSYTLSGTGAGWQNDTKSNLLSTDIGLVTFTGAGIGLDLSQNPDFSGSGSILELGFSTAGHTPGNPDGSTQIVGYDNWSTTVEFVPEPVTLLFLAAGGGAILRKTRSRRSHLS